MPHFFSFHFVSIISYHILHTFLLPRPFGLISYASYETRTILPGRKPVENPLKKVGVVTGSIVVVKTDLLYLGVLVSREERLLPYSSKLSVFNPPY